MNSAMRVAFLVEQLAYGKAKPLHAILQVHTKPGFVNWGGRGRVMIS